MEVEGHPPADERLAHLQAWFATLSVCGVALTPAGIVVAVSAAFAELFQVPREGLLGKAFARLVAPQERTLFDRLLTRSASERAVHDELILRRRDEDAPPIFATIWLRRLRWPLPETVLLLAMDHNRHNRFAERIRREKAELEARVAERTAALAAANQALRVANSALAAEHAMTASVLEQLPDALLVLDIEKRIILANPAARQLLGADPHGRPFEEARARLGEIFDADGRPVPADEAAVVKALQGETCVSRELLVLAPTGEKRVFSVNAVPLRDAGQAIVGALAHYADVTRLRQVLGEVPEALDEGDVLVREMRHRFRNNLAILAALLGLQSDSVISPEAREALAASQQRVYSMARLQDQLHLGGRREAVHMGIYLGSLTTSLIRSYGRPAVRVAVTAESVKLDADRASSVGLIVNELVTNAFKHAFPEEATGEVGVSLSERDGEYRLCVWDSGRGLLSDQAPEHSSSFGLRLVHLLVRRLGGTLAIDTAAGSHFTIAFPVTHPSAKA